GVQVDRMLDGVHSFHSAGVADLNRRTTIQPDSRFRIASTTKAFVAALTLVLVDEGALDLDDTLDHWLPGIAGDSGVDASAIRLRDLLGHRSGIANHVDELTAELAQAESPGAFMQLLQRHWTPRELVEQAFARGPQAQPGRVFGYSDTNYVLIGMIIEAATGESWQRQLPARVLEPLALSHTFIPGAELGLSGTHMHGYAELPFARGYRDVTALSASALDAAAALVSTPSDVNRFFASLLAGELISSASLREMTRVLPVSDEPGAPSYGLGIAYTPLGCGGGYYGHPGDTLGFHTRNAVSVDGARSVCIALSGDGEFEQASAALIENVLCD
ncbi:MAG TPA: serine hydrolase domain-containing protein, partial [Polyangiales bacterium]